MAPELFALRGLSRRVDIRKVAFAPCASMTHRVILGLSNPLTSATERSSWSERTLSLEGAENKLQFEPFSTAVHSPPSTLLGNHSRAALALAARSPRLWKSS